MGERLAHAESGPTSGDPVVFLHGITANRAHWQPVVDVLSDRFRCINVDLLGHGESPQGSGSALSPTERRLQELIPRGTVEVWDGLGHFVQLVDPDRTAARIAAFVDSLS